jgi:hypothetical protein
LSLTEGEKEINEGRLRHGRTWAQIEKETISLFLSLSISNRSCLLMIENVVEASGPTRLELAWLFDFRWHFERARAFGTLKLNCVVCSFPLKLPVRRCFKLQGVIEGGFDWHSYYGNASKSLDG